MARLLAVCSFLLLLSWADSQVLQQALTRRLLAGCEVSRGRFEAVLAPTDCWPVYADGRSAYWDYRWRLLPGVMVAVRYTHKLGGEQVVSGCSVMRDTRFNWLPISGRPAD